MTATRWMQAQSGMPPCPMAAPAPPPPMDYAKSDIAVGGASTWIARSSSPIPNGGGGAPPGTAPLMAYTYGWNFAVPTSEMSSLLAAHKKLCEDAGPAKCYVTSSNLGGDRQGGRERHICRCAPPKPWVRDVREGRERWAEAVRRLGLFQQPHRRGTDRADRRQRGAPQVDGRLPRQPAGDARLQARQAGRPARRSSRRWRRRRATSTRASPCWRR